MGRPSRPVNPVIGDRIKQARRSVIIDGKRMTQELLANKLYISCQAVKNWEQHINEPDNGNLKSIAKICNVSIYWLSGFIDDVLQSSSSILEDLSPEYMKEHDELAKLLLRIGCDLTIFEIENSNFFPYIKQCIKERKNEDVETVLKDGIKKYEMLKVGFRK